MLRYRLLIPLKRSVHSPEQVARGVLIGLLWGLTPTVGIQIALVVLTWLVATRLLNWDFHLLVAIAWTWLTNPITALPIYYVFYITGQAMLGHWDDLAGYDSFAALWQSAFGQDLGFAEATLHYLYTLAKDWGLTMLLGSVPYMTLGALLGYRLTLSFVRRYRKARRKRASRKRRGRHLARGAEAQS